MVNLKESNRADIQDLRFLLDGLEDVKISELFEQWKMGLQLQLKDGTELKI